MRIQFYGFLLAALSLAGSARASAAALSLRAELKPQQLDVRVGDSLFTSYKFAPTQKYPYLWPVNGPKSGRSVTTETSEPYPHHHSLFFGCDQVNGGNYWQDSNARGQILSQGPKLVTASGERVVFTDRCVWRQPDQDPILDDQRRIVVRAPSADVRLIDFEFVLTPRVPVRIKKTNHSLFAARVAPELNVTSGGVLINAEGKTREAGTFGAASAWCDYSGARQGITEGLAILQYPGNRWFPAPWFTRDYGFFSPTPMFWIESGQVDLPAGQPLRLYYRVVVHGGDATAAGINRWFEDFRELPVELRAESASSPRR